MYIYHIKMLLLTFEEFNNEFDIDNKAMSNIRKEDVGKDISNSNRNSNERSETW